MKTGTWVGVKQLQMTREKECRRGGGREEEGEGPFYSAY